MASRKGPTPKSTRSGGASGRVTPKGTRPAARTGRRRTAPADTPGAPPAEGSGRYTPPSSHAHDRPSPRWVPILMFSLLAVGTLVIITNYLGFLPGDTDNRYLLLGLGLITGGFVTATQYR